MFTAGKVLDIMARRNIDLKEFSKSIEKPIYIIDKVACPWEKKGTVMRRLSEEVRSDDFSPYIHIFVEAQDKTKADSLLDTYKKKLESFKK